MQRPPVRGETVRATSLCPACPRQENLELGGLLGEGAFARVVHARDASTGEEYALKIVDKRRASAKGRGNCFLLERNLLSTLNHPGIIKLHAAFHNDWALYFVLELAAGGELAAQIYRMGVCPLHFAQFYVAELAIILEYLRGRRVAHRDLKPENCLLKLDGHLKLSDFDTAVVVPEEGPALRGGGRMEHGEGDGDAAGGGSETRRGPPVENVVGTALYLPPEVLAGTAQLQAAFALDLWALGCIIFQMLLGETPFQAPSECLVFQRILRGEYAFPENFPHRAARQLISALLEFDPSLRLGIAAEGHLSLAQLKRHSFFGTAPDSFEELLQRRPPSRLCASSPRWERGAVAPSSSFQFASSAECTPEVGERFLAKESVYVEVAESPAFDLGVVDQEAAASFALLSFASSRHSRSSSSQCHSFSGPSFSSHSSPAIPTVRIATPHHWVQSDAPFDNRKQWLHELTLRRVLHCGEDVKICGSVVRRWLPCLKPKVLMLTDLPRLLLLDAAGLVVCQELDLAVRGREAIVSVTSAVDFVLRVAGRKYYCSDVNAGAGDWAAQISFAQEKVVAWRLGVRV